MIDIHVLIHSETRADWLEQCIESLYGQPCTVHVIQGIEGSVGAGRAIGYRAGDHKYVGYLDSDDYALPGAMDACLEGLSTNRSVVTMERVMHPDGTYHPYPKPNHNICVYRRADVIPYLAAMERTPHSTDMRMRAIMRPAQLAIVGCVWRIHSGGDHRNLNKDIYDGESAPWQLTT